MMDFINDAVIRMGNVWTVCLACELVLAAFMCIVNIMNNPYSRQNKTMVNNLTLLARRTVTRDTANLKNFVVPLDYQTAFNAYRTSLRPLYPSEMLVFKPKQSRPRLIKLFVLTQAAMVWTGLYLTGNVEIALYFTLLCAAMTVCAIFVSSSCAKEDLRMAKKSFNKWLNALDSFFGNDYFLCGQNSSAAAQPVKARNSDSGSSAPTEGLTLSSLRANQHNQTNSYAAEPRKLKTCGQNEDTSFDTLDNRQPKYNGGSRLDYAVERINYLMKNGVNENTAREVVSLMDDPAVKRRTPEQQRKLNEALGQLLQLIADFKDDKVLS